MYHSLLVLIPRDVAGINETMTYYITVAELHGRLSTGACALLATEPGSIVRSPDRFLCDPL